MLQDSHFLTPSIARNFFLYHYVFIRIFIYINLDLWIFILFKGHDILLSLCEVADVLIKLMGETPSQFICMSNHHIHFRYLTILLVNDTSIKPEKYILEHEI